MSDIAVSPDLVPPVDLTFYDRTPEEIRTLGITFLQQLIPGVTMREGLTEVALLDAFALQFSEEIYAINRVPDAVLDSVFRLMGIERDPGAASTVDITFTLADDDGHTVPAGTRVQLNLQTGGVVFALDEDAVAAPTETQATVSATATTFGAAANGIDAGTPMSLIDAVFYVDSAETDTEVANGREPEDQAAWELRAVQRLLRLTDVLVTAPQFTAAALEHAPIHRAFTIASYDGAGGPPYTNGGHVTIVVRGPSGNVSAPDKAALLADLEDRVVAGVVIHLIDATITNVNVTVAVAVKAGYADADVVASVEAALDAYLDPATWPWSATVRRNELIALIDGVAGVDWVDDPVTPASDVALAGDGPLANAGTIDITVTS